MSGVTCSAFRRLIKELNGDSVGLMVSEFISVEALTRKVQRSIDMMRFREMERPYGIQIFGYDVVRMRDAAIMAQDSGADLIDINCGCPAPKVVRNGGGCELMRQPDHLAKILKEVRKVVSVPLTMKFRSGWDETSRNAVEIARLAESEGLEGVTVHGRTRSQLYRGDADWGSVQEVADAVKIPVSGSGDIIDRASAFERLKPGVQGLFIGRGAIRNPMIFKEIVHGNEGYLRRNPLELVSVVERYIELLEEDFAPNRCVGRIKQLVSQMCRGYPWSKDVCRAATLRDQQEILKRARETTAQHFNGTNVPDDQSEESEPGATIQ